MLERVEQAGDEERKFAQRKIDLQRDPGAQCEQRL